MPTTTVLLYGMDNLPDAAMIAQERLGGPVRFTGRFPLYEPNRTAYTFESVAPPPDAVLRAHYVAVDGEGEPTIWRKHPDRPEALIRRVDLPAAHREFLWNSLVAGIVT